MSRRRRRCIVFGVCGVRRIEQLNRMTCATQTRMLWTLDSTAEQPTCQSHSACSCLIPSCLILNALNRRRRVLRLLLIALTTTGHGGGGDGSTISVVAAQHYHDYLLRVPYGIMMQLVLMCGSHVYHDRTKTLQGVDRLETTKTRGNTSPTQQ